MAEHTNARLFWLINFGVWSIFYLIQGTTSPIFLAYPSHAVVLLIGHFLLIIMLITGLYRFIYQKYAFWTKSFRFTFFQSMIAAAVMCLMDIFMRFKVLPLIVNLYPVYYNWYNININQSSLVTDNSYMNVYRMTASDKNVAQFVSTMQYSGQIMKFLAYIIWTFAFNAYRYSANLVEARVEKYRSDARLKAVELENLRAQLNPHFLFNSLNSIHSMTLMKKEEASDAVLLLSDLMRYTLNYEKKDLVTVEEEMEAVDKYLQLEKIRFGKKLNYLFDIEPHTLKLKIPIVSVQTLAENAIKHAIARTIKGGHIRIKSFLINNNLTIEIINSGQLTEADPSVFKPKDSGIGIENIRRRLSMLYGEKARFDLVDLGVEEVKATLVIPV